ncbi:MAG TPA: FapA family protein, partial [Spirochaetia bacterium]|nr:FapA family protein [Spirochaetia bacterium]
TFFAGPETELTDYLLAQGRPPKPGGEPKLEWRALFLPAGEADRIRAEAIANKEHLKTLDSLSAFPLERVEAVARVKPDTEVLKISPSTGAEAGVDVFGVAIPPPAGTAPDVRLYGGLALRRDLVLTTESGILEKGSDGMAILLRVRSHKDAELRVGLSKDRMKATLSFSPAEGDGERITVSEVRARIAQAGVTSGINEQRLLSVLDGIARSEPLTEVLIAEGKKPTVDVQKRIIFHVHIATGQAVSLRADGRADFRAQDRITRVKRGVLLATVKVRDPSVEDGWDVTGAPIAPPPEALETLKAGRGVREDVQTDGSVRFTSENDGELIRDGSVLSVMDAHTVHGDVDMSTGNVNFPGIVHVTGSIRSGFTVVAEGVLEVGEGVEGALLSSGGTITVGEGIKGEGKAILRARKDIESAFAEQAVLLAIGDVHLRGACVRCQIKCNGRLLLDSEKGSLVGGEVRASRGVVVQNIGSPGGTHTIVSFGQDFLVRDRIEREEQEILNLTKKVADLDALMIELQKKSHPAVSVGAGAQGLAAAVDAAARRTADSLATARAQKLTCMKVIEQRKLRLIGLRDKFDEHVPSEVMVRGTLYPGAVLECHGRRYEVRTEKKMITLRFDPDQGKIVEKL